MKQQGQSRQQNKGVKRVEQPELNVNISSHRACGQALSTGWGHDQRPKPPSMVPPGCVVPPYSCVPELASSEQELRGNCLSAESSRCWRESSFLRTCLDKAKGIGSLQPGDGGEITQSTNCLRCLKLRLPAQVSVQLPSIPPVKYWRAPRLAQEAVPSLRRSPCCQFQTLS